MVLSGEVLKVFSKKQETKNKRRKIMRNYYKIIQGLELTKKEKFDVYFYCDLIPEI
jgi:hypothetical protein